jgi:hypothetical protein
MHYRKENQGKESEEPNIRSSVCLMPDSDAFLSRLGNLN